MWIFRQTQKSKIVKSNLLLFLWSFQLKSLNIHPMLICAFCGGEWLSKTQTHKAGYTVHMTTHNGNGSNILQETINKLNYVFRNIEKFQNIEETYSKTETKLLYNSSQFSNCIIYYKHTVMKTVILHFYLIRNLEIQYTGFNIISWLLLRMKITRHD